MDLPIRNYAFTVQIPAFKRINYKGNYIQYKKLSSASQEDYIYSLVRTGTLELVESYEIQFEKHTDGRIHAHGSFYSLSDDAIEIIKKNIGFLVGVHTDKQINEVCYCIPILNSYNQTIWDNYTTKEQKDNVQANADEKVIIERDYSDYLFGKKKYIE